LLIQKEPFLFKCILEIFSIYRKVCFLLENLALQLGSFYLILINYITLFNMTTDSSEELSSDLNAIKIDLKVG